MEQSRRTRPRALPPGWYPEDPDEVRSLVQRWTSDSPRPEAFSAISPHAGWYFSGELAAMAVASLRRCDTVVVVAGHLSASASILIAEEDAYETVMGPIEADSPLASSLADEIMEAGFHPPLPDRATDNGVEVLLPLVAALHPGAKALWLRCPPNYTARELGAALMRAAVDAGRTIAVLGSTDLTHYGPAYGFEPAGRGAKAELWALGVNDKAFVDALVDMNPTALIDIAVSRHAACSGGAAAAALCFAIEAGGTEILILGRSSSLDKHQDSSFVGYCAAAFR